MENKISNGYKSRYQRSIIVYTHKRQDNIAPNFHPARPANREAGRHCAETLFSFSIHESWYDTKIGGNQL